MNKFLFTFAASFLMLATSCVKDYDIDQLNSSTLTDAVDNFTTKEDIQMLPSNIQDLSASDAQKVAQIFINKSRTRGNDLLLSESTEVKNTVPILSHNGSIAMYAVNFKNGGFMIISATTSFFPILAVVENGEYNNSGYLEVAENYIEDLAEKVMLAKTGELKIDCTIEWSAYKDFESTTPSTRASDEYLNALYSWMEEQNYGTYRIYKLKSCKDLLPEKVYNEFLQAVKSEDPWEGTEYSGENTAYVVERTTENLINVGPLLSTNWNQDNKAYNISKPDKKVPTGCVTIATGQLMRYFQYPSTFAWNNMSTGGGYHNTELDNFLTTLRAQLGVNDDGGASIDDAERVLKGYGYQVTKQNHDVAKVFNELAYRRKPVYARGQKGALQGGHAWVIDGLYHSESTVKYTLYRLSDVHYPEFKYTDAENADPYSNYTSLTMFHMNWGWGGGGNGMFMDSNITVTLQSGTHNFYYDRKELFLTRP